MFRTIVVLAAIVAIACSQSFPEVPSQLIYGYSQDNIADSALNGIGEFVFDRHLGLERIDVSFSESVAAVFVHYHEGFGDMVVAYLDSQNRSGCLKLGNVEAPARQFENAVFLRNEEIRGIQAMVFEVPTSNATAAAPATIWVTDAGQILSAVVTDTRSGVASSLIENFYWLPASSFPTNSSFFDPPASCGSSSTSSGAYSGSSGGLANHVARDPAGTAAFEAKLTARILAMRSGRVFY